MPEPRDSRGSRDSRAPHTARLRDRLRAEAAHRFVGRDAELALLCQQLADAPATWPVILLHGPGGVGKTTLLDRLLDRAANAGVAALRLDGREVDPSADGFLRAVGGALGLDADGCTLAAVTNALGSLGRRLLVIDTFEAIQPLEAWMRETFLPSCPERLVTVLASRITPDRAWRADPLWLGHARDVLLANLSADEGAEYAQQRGLDAALARQVVTLSHGHPLALSVLTDIAASNGAVPAALAADVFRDLASRFTAVAPSARHRRALEACALLRRTTVELLAQALGEDDAPALFDWLGSLNFVEHAVDGLFPHDLMRDAVLDEFFAREPERYRQLRRVMADELVGRLMVTPPETAWPLVCDFGFLYRHRSPLRHYNDYRTMGSAHFRPARPADAAALDDLAATELSPIEVPIARRWLAHPAAIVWVAGGAPGRVDGAVISIDMDKVDDEMRTIDPIVARLADALARVAPPLPGRVRLLARFHPKRGGMFEVRGGVANAIQMAEWYLWLTTPALQLSALCVPRPEHWAAMMSYFGFATLVDGEFEVAGERYGTYWREWRDRPPRDTALQRVATRVDRPRRMGSGLPSPPTQAWPEAPADGILSREEFVSSVRDALRQLRRDAQLSQSPLLRARVVRAARRASETPVATLRRVLVETAQEQRATPRHAKGWRALDLTYFRPAGTQELAAERLGLPFNTYRYQLNAGLLRLADRLWELESALDE